MGRVVRFESPRTVVVAHEDEAAVGPGDVRLMTLFSGISAGTELSFYRGTNPYLEKRWDPEQRLFVPKEPAPASSASPSAGGRSTQASTGYPVDGTGYEEVGEVVEVGPDVVDVHVGDVVWGTWGHRESVVRTAEYAGARTLAGTIPPIIGVFSQIGSIALNVVLDADIHVGETVGVFGLGVLGQIVAQLARLNGARVIAVDRFSWRLELAQQLGGQHLLNASEGAVAERIRDLTSGRGADVCLEVSGVYPALHEAIRSVAYSARVVAAGFFQGEGIGLALGEEFHHNRVQVVCSQIGGVAPALGYRWDAYRLQSTFMDLATSKKVQVEPLVSRVMPVEQASQGFELLDQTPEEVMQVVLSFGRETG